MKRTPSSYLYVLVSQSSVYYPLSNMLQQDWSVHGCRLSLHRRKLQVDISRSKRPDRRSTQCSHRPTHSNIATVLQQLPRDTRPERRSSEYLTSIPANVGCFLRQHLLVQQFGSLPRLRDYRDTDPTMGPTVSGSHAGTRHTCTTCTCAASSDQWPYKIPRELGPPVAGHVTALCYLPLLPGFDRLYLPHRPRHRQ